MNQNELIEKYKALLEDFVKSKEYTIYAEKVGKEAVALLEQCEMFPCTNSSDREEKVIISLTSIKPRVAYAEWPIKNMLLQSYKPDKIILWLDKMTMSEADIPSRLLELKDNGLEIRFVEDIGPHTKYFYAMQEFENDCVITIDDDMLYQLDMIEGLVKTHKKYPDSVCTYLPKQMRYTRNGIPYPLEQCGLNVRDSEVSSFNFAQGVCGVLYPPKCIEKKYFDATLIRKIALKQDDIWLYIAEFLSGTKVAKVDIGARVYPYVDGAQVTALRFDNQRGGNDTYFRDLFEYFHLYEKFSGVNKNENENKTHVFMKWIELLQQGQRVSNYLEHHHIPTVSIYGFGQLGRLLYKELVADGVRIEYVIDNCVEDTPALHIKRNEEVDGVAHMLIITAPVNMDYVMKNVKCAKECIVISLMDIFIEMEHQRIG